MKTEAEYLLIVWLFNDIVNVIFWNFISLSFLNLSFLLLQSLIKRVKDKLQDKR